MSEQVVTPGSPGHDAARRVLATAHEASQPRPRPDTFRYDVSIAAPAGDLLRGTFRDPLPDDVAELLATLSDRH